jgi:energy-coupling factor transporter ATP-binding protein EcfA2
MEHSTIQESDSTLPNAVLERVSLFWEPFWIGFRKTKPSHSSCALWLFGPAGAGKSALAQMIAGICHGEGRLAASFFFSRPSPKRSDSTSLIATIAYQIALNIPASRSFIEDATFHLLDVASNAIGCPSYQAPCQYHRSLANSLAASDHHWWPLTNVKIRKSNPTSSTFCSRVSKWQASIQNPSRQSPWTADLACIPVWKFTIHHYSPFSEW